MLVVGAKGEKKHMQVGYDWFYLWLVEKMIQDFLANHKVKQCKTKTIESLF